MRWGLIPSWSKGVDSRYSMINARAESIHEKPAYKRPFRRSRCLIPASGFYEWKKQKDKKQPYCITHKDHQLMAFAGIWDLWKGQSETIKSCSIITTDAASSIRHIHERMPVILENSAFATWLDTDNQNIDQLTKLLSPCPDSKLDSWPVSQAVNSPANDGERLIEAVK